MRSALGGIMLALLAPGIVRAQSLADLKAAKARLTRESDSLVQLAKRPPVMDTIRLGDGWVVAASPSVRDLVDASTLAALQAGQAQFGGVLDPRMTPVEIHLDPTRIWGDILEVRVGAGNASLSKSQFQALERRRGALPFLVRQAFHGAAFGIADSALQRWAGGTLGQDFGDLVDAARVRLQRDTGVEVQGCRQRSLSACIRALGGGTPASAPEFSSVVRRSLVRFDLQRAGGDSALPRLYAGPGRPVLDRLATLAGMPVDTLVAQWHQAVIRQDELTPRGAVLALLGAAVLLVLGIWGAQWRRV